MNEFTPSNSDWINPQPRAEEVNIEMNEDKKIMLKNKIHEIKFFIRDELTLEELLELKEVLDDAIDGKE
tara:strand:- start:2185 stop:2391 length:207 start_codon:yes stop_codon:yes gene_type:complete